jgi:hypothetical protein
MENLQSEIELQIARLDSRLQELNSQIERADRLLFDLEIPEAAPYIPRTQEYPGDDDSEGFEIDSQYIDSSDDETVEYSFPYENYDEEEYYSDTETIVEGWEDPFLTPDKSMRLLIPNDLEEGLEFLS